MRNSARHTNTPVQRPSATVLQSALAGEAQAVGSLLQAGWTLWISPAILQGKRGIVELRFQSAEGRERYALPVWTFLALRDEGIVTAQQGSPDDMWVRCSLSERTLNAMQSTDEPASTSSVASSAA